MSFTRLYGDLVRGKEKDPEFRLEREELLFRLGHDVGRVFKTERITGPKYHGKLARCRDPGHDTKMLFEKDDRFKRSIETKKSVSTTLNEADMLHKTTAEISKLMASGKHIPDSVIMRLPCGDSGDKSIITLPKISSAAAPMQTRVNDRSPKQISLQIPVNVKARTIVQSKSVSNKGFTQERWSKDERQRINEIYASVEQPRQKKSIELWTLYFEDFASRFQKFFPRRTSAEVILKVQEMIAKRQLKEHGEIEYWKELQG
jgi:hypothetical protein